MYFCEVGSSALTERSAPWENVALGRDTFLPPNETRKREKRGDGPKDRAREVGVWAALVPVSAKRLTLHHRAPGKGCTPGPALSLHFET